MSEDRADVEPLYSRENMFAVWEQERCLIAEKCLKDRGFEEDDCLACDNYDYCTNKLLENNKKRPINK
jgi:hypothetical protein